MQLPGDQYNASWKYGCIDSGLTDADCNDIKYDPDKNVNHESLQEENRRNCYDNGFEDRVDGLIVEPYHGMTGYS